jgi:hypothetical protein
MPYVCIKLPVGPADVVQRVPRHISLTLKTLSSWRAEGTQKSCLHQKLGRTQIKVHPSFWCKRPGGLCTSLARRIGGIDHCFRSAHIIVLADVALPFTKIFTLRVNRFLHVNATHSQGSYF